MTVPVELRVSDSVAEIALNRPDQRNSLNRATIGLLIDALETVDGNDGVQVAVLRGRGAGFSAGADLVEFGALFTTGKTPDRDELRAIAELGDRLIWTLANLRPITVAQVRCAIDPRARRRHGAATHCDR